MNAPRRLRLRLLSSVAVGMPMTQPLPIAASTVLIIDDDRDTCEMIDTALRPLSVIMRRARFGAEAIALARSTRFDLMLIDLNLPDMSGTDIVRALRDDLLHVPFALVSGCLTVSTAVEAMRLGARRQ